MSEETDLALSFKEDHINIPPLLSNSPPPLQFINSEDDDNDATLQRPNITSDFMKLSDSSTSSSSSLPKLNQSTVQYEEKSAAKLKDFDQDWNSNENCSLFKEETNDSQWATFEPNFNDIQTTDNEIKNEEICFNESKPIDDMNDNDDEWGNFVEIEQVHIPTKQNEQSTTLPFDLDTILDEIFKTNQTNSFNKYNDLIIDNLQIETDELWQQIQTFTTVNDSSDSLKFKWCLSYLEDNYFNSLNIQRTSQIKTKNFRTWSPETILQPVKIDSSKSVNHKTNEIKTPQLDITAPALNIDLSYFESKETNKTNLIKQNSNKTDSLTSKVNLDKLLEEIFTSNSSRQESTSQKTMVINGKTDDLFSDKKSLSSSSTSSSSSNINELNQSTSTSSSNNSVPMFLQLQPHMLEMQQMQTNKAYDEKALNIISKLSNVTFKNSKCIVLPR